MKSVGVIVEYNPLHNGHVYHLQKARELSQAEVVIAIMSGNFLQRGEPAFLDKWTRGREALLAGADLVIELPFAYSVQSADYFAAGGIKLLQALNCEALCFGTDVSEVVDYEDFALFQQTHQKEIDAAFQNLRNNGENYPQQMTSVYQKLYPAGNWDFSSPNHILGMSYAKENAKYSKPMKLFPLKREKVGYHETEIIGEVASASGIRKSLLAGDMESVDKAVPTFTFQDLHQESWQNWEKYYSLLRYQLLSQNLSDLAEIFQMEEGLPVRMREAAKEAVDFQSWMNQVKTKRYTWTRLQRLATYVLLEVKPQDIQQVWEQTYLRVLGFNQTGQNYLSQQKETTTLPIITNVKRANESLLSLDIKAGLIYQLGQEKLRKQDYTTKPIRL